MTDTIKFKMALVKNQMTMHDLADEIGLSTTSLSYKVNNKIEFRSSEIIAIQNVLKLSNVERDEIFFACNVD